MNEWPTTPAGDELDAEYGAPTSGGPPYRVYEIRPIRAFGLPSGGETSMALQTLMTILPFARPSST